MAALGSALGAMVANLSANKKGWEEKLEQFSLLAEKGQELKKQLLFLVDEDTKAFNQIMLALRLPKKIESDKIARNKAIQLATKNAIDQPFKIMQTSLSVLELLAVLVNEGLPASISDIGVGALAAGAAVKGASLNVKINCKDLSEPDYVKNIYQEVEKLQEKATELENSILDKVNIKIH